ncbi:MAG TPA: hypothetical protein VFV05_22960 [Methylomirabilota bacterium]|nr:hypothetical protein [Methylomirabilota bacterium]
MKQAHHELGHRLAALRADFAALGTRAAGAATALTATLPPPAELLEELTAARDAFADLRGAMVAQAGALSLVLDDEALGTLSDLEPVLAAIAAAEERRAQLAAWRTAREDARSVLEQVTALIHREGKPLPALADCQDRARELHTALTGPLPDDLDDAIAALPTTLRPYTDLLALVEGWSALDDDRCALLQDAVSQAFGRALGLAALRGKLGRTGETPPPAPRPAPPRPMPRLAAPAPPPTPRLQDEPVTVIQPVAPAAPAPVEASDARTPTPSVSAGGVGAGGGLVGDPVTGAPADSPVVEIRLSGDKIATETPAARREREELLERLAQDTAHWWIAARQGWTGMRERGLGVADAARDYLAQFPYLLSVPLQKSADSGGGRLAEGYALLLAHIEKQEPGFVQEGLTRLNPQFTTGATDQSFPLGQELYLYVVAEGRLYKTYPDFVREVIQHAIPEPGPWVQGGIVESDDETRVFMRAAPPGSTEEQTRTVRDGKDRLGPHVLTVAVGPLTTRFFTLRAAAATLTDPPDVEIKLRDNDAPSDRAWLITLPASGKARPSAPRRHRTGGTTLPELGKEFTDLWLAVFNPDPAADHRYDLSITLRRKPPQAPAAAKSAPPASSKFFGRKR